MIFLLFKSTELNKKYHNYTQSNEHVKYDLWSISELWPFGLFGKFDLSSIYCPIPPVSCSCIQRAWRRTPCLQRARGDKSDNPRPGTICGPEGSHWKIHKYKCNTPPIHTITGNPAKNIHIGISRNIPNIILNVCLFVFYIFVLRKPLFRGEHYFSNS